MQRALATEKHPLPRPSPASGRGEMSVRFDAFLSANTFKSPVPLGHLRKAFGFTQGASGRGETSVSFDAFLSVPSNLPSPACGRGAGGEGKGGNKQV